MPPTSSLVRAELDRRGFALNRLRIGLGFDVHRLDAPGSASEVTLGGVAIPFDRRIIAHSDGDVVLHALMDAMLGAAALGDIGEHFPDTDSAFAGTSSVCLLERTSNLIGQSGCRLVNCDLTLIAERPKVRAYIGLMRQAIAHALGRTPSDIGMKATTSEKLGFVGREEGIAAQAVVLLERT